MPELPEVEVVRAGLEPILVGATITSVTVHEPRSLRRHLGHSEDFCRALSPRRILEVARRGKFLWCTLEGDEALVAHLGMSGQLLIGQPDSDFGSHCRVRLDLTDQAGTERSVGFVDQRIFGSLVIDPLVATSDGKPGGAGSTRALVPASAAHIARDPGDPAFDEAAWVKALCRRRTGIKRALLDQGLISGVGNIYADEALWASKLHYDTPTHRLSPARARQLLGHIRDVFRRALAEGGTSFDRQYVNVNGQSGYFSRSLHAYGRDGEPCERCGSIIVRERFMNRSSYRCPRCQKRPATR